MLPPPATTLVGRLACHRGHLPAVLFAACCPGIGTHPLPLFPCPFLQWTKLHSRALPCCRFPTLDRSCLSDISTLLAQPRCDPSPTAASNEISEWLHCPSLKDWSLVPSRGLSVPPAASVAVVVRLGDKAPVIAPSLSSGRAQPRYLGASPSRRWSSLDLASALLDLPP
jgi:hypothetical protein